MAKRVTKWMWVRALRAEEKAAIADRCERFIREELKPRFLPEELGYGRASRNPMALIEAIGDANVIAFLSGHVHRLDRIEAKGQIFICSGSVSGDQWKGPEVDTAEGFAVIDCRADGSFDCKYQAYRWEARRE